MKSGDCMKEERDVICLKDEAKKTAKLEFEEIVKEGVWIRLSLDHLIVENTGENYFDTLIKIRQVLERHGIKLLCKGACKCVYPSAMILSMGTGRMAYQLAMGRQAGGMETLVDIFDDCNSWEYATIEEQKQYFQEWCNSLQKKSNGNIRNKRMVLEKGGFRDCLMNIKKNIKKLYRILFL